MLLNMTAKGDERYALMEEIHKDANWLHALVENILSFTRLNDGRLVLNKQEEAAEEVVGVAVRHISRRSPEYDITINMPDELLLVPMDVKLIEQVLINLLDNAIKHTAPPGEISISATEYLDKRCAVFSVCDTARALWTVICQIFLICSIRRG